MRPAPLAVALGLLSCGASPPAREAARPTVTRARAARPEAARTGVWETLPAAGWEGTVRDLAALPGGAAVVLFDHAIARWTPEGLRPTACASSAEEGDFIGVRADGVCFVALAGNEARPTLWRSSDGGATCARGAVPSPAVRDTDVGRLGFTLRGPTILLWSSGGGIIRSDDLGHAWRRLPSLDGVLQVELGPADAVLAAASLSRGDVEARVALFALNPPGDRWRALPGAGHLRSPVAIIPADGGALIAHAAGASRVGPDLTLVDGRTDFAARSPHHALRIITPAGDGRALASTGAVLSWIDRSGRHPFAALPGLRPIEAIDASPDGWWWATDHHALWRGRFEEPPEPLWSLPLVGEHPVAMAARGGRVMVVGSSRTVALRDLRGESGWQTLTLPEGLGRPVAGHIDERGALFVLTTSGLAVADARRFVAVPAPSVPSEASARFVTFGDRWLIASARVWVSDDRGARWEARLGDAGERALPGVAVTVPLGYAFDREAVVALDSARGILRADGPGHRFEQVTTLPLDEGAGRGRNAQAVVAWDGASHLAVFAGGAVFVSRDGGQRFAVRDTPFAPRWAAWVDDALVASGALSRLVPARCRGDLRQSLFVLADEGWVTDPEACEHRGAVTAQDGDELWMLGAGVSLQRVSLARFVRSLLSE